MPLKLIFGAIKRELIKDRVSVGDTKQHCRRAHPENVCVYEGKYFVELILHSH